MKNTIKRNFYIEKIKPYVKKDIIKVLTGQRRVGKSYLIYQIIDYIKSIEADANIIYINKELHEFDFIKNSHDLVQYCTGKTPKNNSLSYLFIDEIQEIVDFEKALRSLQAEGGYDIYCTGSNANLLSGELATFLSGRHVEIKIFGLSYKEFLHFHDLNDDNTALLKYMKFGGLPFLINLSLEEEIVYDYLRNIYSTILYKDIVKRHKIRSIAFLERLVEYIADNTGSIVSSKKISDFLKSQKINISTNIVLEYLSFLSEAFFIFKVKRAKIGGKKIFEIGEKYYFEDLGLRHTIAGYNQADINKVLENIVFLHLKIHGYDINVGELNSGEIDFVCRRGYEKIYIQVTYLIPDENVHKREFGNLLSIKDNHRKIVVSMDELSGNGFKGIEHIHVREFLGMDF